jgi:hypothetical protein
MMMHDESSGKEEKSRTASHVRRTLCKNDEMQKEAKARPSLETHTSIDYRYIYALE